MVKHILCLITICVLMFSVSCSGGGDNVVAPPVDEGPIAAESMGSVACLGFWQVTIYKSGKVDITDLRSADLVINVLQFMEPPPMTKLKVKFGSLVIDPVNKLVEADVVLKHPIPMQRYRGFDVRGVVFGPHVTNADGITVIPSPEFFTGVMFGYVDGMLGIPDSVANYEGLAGYKYFCDGLGENDDLATFMSDPGNVVNRGTFSPGNKLTRHYVLEWMESDYDFMVFNYAIYANYADPIPPGPITIDNFPITTANSQEAFCFEATEISNSLYFDVDTGTGGGHLDLQIEVWDWQGNINDVVVGLLQEHPFPYDSHLALVGPGSTDYSYVYEIDGYSPNVITTGDLDLLIMVFDDNTFGESWFANMLPPGNPLYGDFIYNCFIHTTIVSAGEEPDAYQLPYDDPMDTTTESRWSVEKYWGDHTAPNADWYQEGNQWVCNDPATGKYEDVMTTWLVSPPIQVPATGAIHAEITFKYSVEQDWDNVHVGLDLVGDGDTWTFFTDANGDPVSGFLTGDSPGYPDYQITGEWLFFENLTPGQIVRLGFILIADDSGSDYDGCFVDHVLLDENFPQLPPVVGPITGEANVTSFGSYQYSAVALDANGDYLTYEWETGDDDPAQYDDGPGNGDGTIDINWDTPGLYILDCRVTDDGSPPLDATSSAPLVVVVFELPTTPGPSEDFEGSWPFTGWSFNDHTVAGTGEFWGKTNAIGTNCLDADGADDSCYGNIIFEEAQWEDVVVPNSPYAVLKITHTMWAEGYYDIDYYFYDGGMLFIDNEMLTEDDCISGVFNHYYHPEEFYWTPNTYWPTWPGLFTNFAWSGNFPDPVNWLNGFAVTYMDISDYADGNTHDFSFIFHSEEMYCCEEGGDYRTWLIDKIEIFYE